MAESLVSGVLDKLFAILGEQVTQELNLVIGVDEQVQKLTSNLQAIHAVVEDAERRQVHESAVKLWLHNLKDITYDIDDVLDEWSTAILKQKMEQEAEASVEDAFRFTKKVRYAFSYLSSHFRSRQVVLWHDIVSKIGELNSKLDAIASQRNRYNFKSGKASHEQRKITTSIMDESEVFVREIDESKIKEMLLCENSQEKNNLRIISIVGMGGIGKTTLARLAYNDAEVKSQFDVRIWVCVSDPFEEERIAVEILESLLGEKPNLVGRENMLQGINRLVSRKKILLVLDDVWTEDSSDWEQLKGSLKSSSLGSRILVTTRKQTVANIMGSKTIDMFSLGQLSEEKCWSLFFRLAFFERKIEDCRNLENIGRKIVERCKGLPLAVKVVGGLLRFKETKEQWHCILDSEMWEIEEVEKGVFPPLLLSYYDLPPILRKCFSYCAIFPKDYVIEKEKLIYLWMAQGFLRETRYKNMKIIGEEYFNKLAMLSFFQDFEKHDGNTIYNCKMHDIVHDFAQFLTAKECLLIEIDGLKESWQKPAFETTHHSMMLIGINDIVGISMENWRKLRSLLINTNGWKLESSILNSIDQLTCLRALDLSRSIHSMLTNKIGKLTRLRYLNLSGNRELDLLPEAICDLYNLQSLDINHCTRLKELPCGMGKLINLVYLENRSTSDLRFMPKGMERLTHLQTLKMFVVSSSSDSEIESCSYTCSLEGLGKLNHLEGYLRIRGLGNVTKSSKAKEAQLSAKIGLRHLTLQFDSKWKQRRIEDESLVLEALQPPSFLENLEIWHFKGPPLFPWMMSLTMLKIVTLCDCQNWEILPPLGKIPFLEQLRIYLMDKVKRVGEEFFGIEREDKQTSSSSSYTSNDCIAFPKLNRLEFLHMHKWEDWEYGNLSTRRETSCCFIIMPCLQHLVIHDCPLLKTLPHHILHHATIQLSDRRGRGIPKERFGKRGNLSYTFHIDPYRQTT